MFVFKYVLSYTYDINHLNIDKKNYQVIDYI